MTSETEIRVTTPDDRPTSRVEAALWGSLVWGTRGWGGIRRRVLRGGPDRGDVPGWVLVTLMTAGLVTALWVLAGDALGKVFTDAIESVTGP